MVAKALANFGGMIPAVDERLLPENQSGLSENTWVYTGTLEGFREPVLLHTLVNTQATKAYRIPINFYDRDHMDDAYWLEFENPDTDVISSPSVGDTFERFYWASTGIAPQYNTKARIALGSASFKLGIPAPGTAPSVVVTLGAPPTETRAYVYTWVSAYGEEGPPSPPVLQTGNASGTWTVTMTAPGAGDTTGRNLNRTRIYRTITGASGSTTYFFVAEVAIATLVYADTRLTTAVAAENILESTFFEAPPTDLEGIITMPNGIVAGFRSNEVWFCEPYLPHAWPSIYTLAVGDPIVGLGVIGQTLVVCTTGSPYVISGTNPATMTSSRLSQTEPCLSRGSIVSAAMGVAYASPNGVVVAVPGQAQVVTRNLINKDDWNDQTNFIQTHSLRAAPLNGGYYAWGSVLSGTFEPTAFDLDHFASEDFAGSYRGIFFDLTNTRVSLTKLYNSTSTVNCYMDTWTSEVFLIREGAVYWLDLGPSRDHEPFLWRTKKFTMPNRRNMGAMRIWFDEYEGTPDQNPVRNTTQPQALAADQFGLVRVYADNRLVVTRELRESGELMRVPSGFKAQYWQIEIEAAVRITSIEFASTAKELLDV